MEILNTEYYRKTILKDIYLKGIGLHSGERVHLNMIPAEPGSGIRIKLLGSRGGKCIVVSPDNVVSTENAVTLSNGEWSIQTVEHILAALYVYGISDVLIEVDSEEMPVMDGSAQPFALAIQDAGVHRFDEKIEPIRVRVPVWVVSGEKYLVALPSDDLKVTYSIDFEHPKLKGKTLAISLDQKTMLNDILPARTFGFIKDVEEMKARGLIKGASEHNALVLTDHGYYNKPRMQDECIRHKVLDLIGDLYLLGRPLEAHFIAFKAGHALDVALGKNILSQMRTDELANRRTIEKGATRDHSVPVTRF